MICILGGTFDPVHYGHLRMAIEVKQALDVDELYLLPSYIPPHRDEPTITPEHRFELLSLAIENESSLKIDGREILRKGPSYMVDTLHSVRQEVGDEPVCLAIGMDALNGLAEWHEWQKLTDYAHIIVMERPGYEIPQNSELASFVEQRLVTELSRLRHQPAGWIYQIPVTQLDISSTKIRQLLAAGMSVRYLLPDNVLDKIKQEGWYLHQ